MEDEDGGTCSIHGEEHLPNFGSKSEETGPRW